METIYTFHIQPAEEGGFVASCPDLPGCHTQGETIEEVLVLAQDALNGYLATLVAHGDPIPRGTSLSKLVGFDIPLRASFSR